MEKVKKVLSSEDFESLSNYANTRYGASMRASPIGASALAARNTQYGVVGNQANPIQRPPNNYGAAGSDGFHPTSHVNNMQNTFLSVGSSTGLVHGSVNMSAPPGAPSEHEMPRYGRVSPKGPGSNQD